MAGKKGTARTPDDTDTTTAELTASKLVVYRITKLNPKRLSDAEQTALALQISCAPDVFLLGHAVAADIVTVTVLKTVATKELNKLGDIIRTMVNAMRSGHDVQVTYREASA